MNFLAFCSFTLSLVTNFNFHPVYSLKFLSLQILNFNISKKIQIKIAK